MRQKIVNFLVKLPGVFDYSLYGVLCHPWEALVRRPLREIKWFWQRGRRGYADCDAWSIGSYLNSWMPQAIRSLKSGHGVPGFLVSDFDSSKEQLDAAYDTWQYYLETMARGFEAQRKMDECEIEFGTHAWKAAEKEAEKGMSLFAKHYMALWD